jgi:hypothetical protein
MTTDEKLHERRVARIAAGREAWASLQKHEHFGQWLAVADCLSALREQAMEEAHTNRPQGPPYRRAFKAIIEQQEPWAVAINDTVRAHCYWLVDNLPAVQSWRETLAFEQRDKWNHPTTVKRNYERLGVTRKAAEKAAPNATRLGLQDQVIRLQEENDALRRRQGAGFLPSASAEEVGEQIAGHHKPEYLRRLAKVLIALAEREERQDGIEARKQGAKRKAAKTEATAPAPAGDGDEWPNLALPAMLELTKGRPPRG